MKTETFYCMDGTDLTVWVRTYWDEYLYEQGFRRHDFLTSEQVEDATEYVSEKVNFQLLENPATVSVLAELQTKVHQVLPETRDRAEAYGLCVA